MKIGIKYCGGCNPRFNRSEFVKKLMVEYINISFEPLSKDKLYDILLIISGCPRACISHDLSNGKEKIYVKSEQDANKVKKIINEHIER